MRIDHSDKFPEHERITLARKPRVLVADDDDDMRALIVAALGEDGYEISEARNGRELLDRVAPSMLFDEASHAPDVIVTDVRMPGVNGLSVLAGLRDTGWATPIILITAFDKDQIRAQGSELGADAVFHKPFDVDDLRTAVLNLLSAGGWRALAPTMPDIA
ncbi:MAG TPA: response regulator [Polyangiaceae bacterium]|nr:response regulator [Polyangiaceae bacterium]